MRGLIPLLENICIDHTFERKSPVRRKPGPRPSNVPGYGRTGRSLAEQIEKLLFESLKAKECCDLVLVIDDLDCHDRDARRELFDKSIGKVDQAANIEHYIGFASPEVEAWIVADWDHSVAKDPDFRGCHNQMRHWLSTQKAVPFDRPETFSSYDREKIRVATSSLTQLSNLQFTAARRRDIPRAFIPQGFCGEFRQKS